ncbi:hypothetical protein ACFVWY_30245 [Streptomyces sp. NPDC058195]|uniref:hypothetical protein n=1 Tax=Streptomyces sp. NPDC058195 TaxID=3346375 RepID=UPI0036E3A930
MSGGGATPVDPVGIPVFTGDLALLDVKVTALSGHGAKIAEKAGDVHRAFGGLRAFYQAPEAEQLFATTAPVAAKGLSLSEDLCVVAGALGTYSDDAFPLVEKLKALKRDAGAFRVKVNADDDWDEDGDLVEENNRRRAEIAEVWAAFQEVERACHAKIVALVGGTPLKTGDGSGKAGTYGFDAETLKQAESLPWGEAVEESVPWWQVWEHAYDFGKGFLVDGVWGTIKGLGTLVGVDGWDATKQAWTGLAKLATGVTIAITPGVNAVFWALPDDKLPSWVRDSRTAMKETGKALVAWDQWGSNPSRAAGAVTFNVLTTVFTGGTGSAAAGAGKAGLAAKTLSLTSKAARVVDPMTYVFKGAGAGLTRIGDAFTRLKGLDSTTIPALQDHVITVPEGAIRLPDGTLHLPEGSTIPEGATALPNGTIKLPEDAVALPEGAIRSLFPDEALYYDRHGNLYNEDGALIQRVDQAPQEASLHAEIPAPVREPALVGATAHTADHTPGGTNHTPPHNHLDDTTPTGGPTRSDLTHHSGEPGTGSTTGHYPPAGSAGDGGLSGFPHPGGPGRGSGLGDSLTPPQRQPVPRPDFMHDGPNPYRSRKPLTQEQIEEIQVYRANEEPGYFERFYRKDGTRVRVERIDESGLTPPQLTRLLETDPWIRAKDAPQPPSPHYLDEKYISVTEKTVKSKSRLKALNEIAKKRFEAIQWDNLMEKVRADADKNHKILSTPDSGRILEEATGDYKVAHTEMRDAAEALGEGAAELHYMADKYPDFEQQPLLGPKNGNDQFDQVWVHEDGRVVVIEAKSSPKTDLGRRTLPNGKQVSQGSREYFFDIIEKMKERGEIKTVAALQEALKREKLEYVAVRGNSNTGTYAGYQYRRFDISKGTLP